MVKKITTARIKKNSINIAYQNLEHTIFLLYFVNNEVPSRTIKQVKKYKRIIIQKFNPAGVKDSMDFDKVIRFIKEIDKRKKSKNGNYLRVQVESTRAHEALSLLTTLSNIETHFPNFVREMSLTYLVSSFENFLGDILTTFYRYELRALISQNRDKQMNYKEIIESKDFDELKGKMVKKEISSVLNKSIDEINLYLGSYHNIKLDKLTEWSEFREIFYRRNIVVHNDGYPDTDYMKKTGHSGVDKLEINQQYLERCFEVFGVYAHLLAKSFYNRKYDTELVSDLQE